MKCLKCDYDKETAFFQETFPCGHCEGENLLEYNICPECGAMWKSLNGEVLADSQTTIQDMSNFGGFTVSDQPELTVEEESIMDSIAEHMKRVERMDAGEASMSDYVHNCLECQSTAVDVIDGKYTCTECGFDWEIIKFE